MPLAQRRPIESFQNMSHRQPFTLALTTHVPRKQRSRLLAPPNVLEKRHLRPERNVIRRLVLPHRVPPLLRRFCKPRCCRCRVVRHERGPVPQRRLGCELRRDAAVREMLGLRFAEEAAGRGHAGDAFQLGEWHFGGVSDGGEGSPRARWGRELSEDIEVDQPAEAGEVLILDRWRALEI